MGKSVSNTVLDEALNYLKNNATLLCVCSSEPTTYTEATSTYELADVTIDSSDFTGPADGDTSGRKITVNAQTAVTIDNSGTAQHVALVDVTNTELLYVTTTTSTTLSAGGEINVGSFDIEIADPT